ncbi:MAG TPA: chemotaxis protein CheW, partial [Spirochaetia bacterium]|nr:chemotaxis protein CheW [Spirochaetia bacterium]
MSDIEAERTARIDSIAEDPRRSRSGPLKSSMRNRKRHSRRDRATDEQVETIDFKMVSFALGGKDYGIDIMKVKEIARFSHFTYVPNCPPYVRGVYNLRGDIISVIDLRRMFNIPVAEAETDAHEGNPAGGRAESGLILRLETTLIGVIVDSIDKVVGISSTAIQPPHPIFADINIKYISGVVEYEDRLYIILDVERILARDSEVGASAAADTRDVVDHAELIPASHEETLEIQAKAPGGSPEPDGDVGFRFITETLATFAGFHVTSMNREWALERYKSWNQAKGEKLQLTSTEDASAFLETFESPGTGRFWPDTYAKQIA